MEKKNNTGALAGRAFPRKATVAWGLLVVALVVAGLPFLIERVASGLGVISTSGSVPWGLWVVAYTWFAGLAGGLFLMSSLGYLFHLRRFMPVARLALACSVPSLLVSMLLIAADLGVMGNAGATVAHFHWSSALSWEIVFYLVFLAIVVAELVLTMGGGAGPDSARGGRTLAVRLLAGFGVALSFVGPPGGTGMIFSVVKARGFWSGGMTAMLTYIAAIVTAAAFLLVLYCLLARLRKRRPNAGTLRALAATLAAGLAALALATYFQVAVPFMGGDALSVQAALNIVAGEHALLFWVCAVGVGMVAAAAFAIAVMKGGNGLLAMAAGALAMVGVFSLRYILVVGGLSVPVLSGIPDPVYVPNAIEVMVALSALGLAAGLYGLVVRLLPLEMMGTAEGATTPRSIYSFGELGELGEEARDEEGA